MTAPDTPLFVRTHDWNLWLLERTQRFPKQLRHSYTNRLESLAFEFEELLLMANAVRGARQGAMHLQQTVNTPGFDHARRAVDVNRPVTSLMRSCSGAGWAGTYRYRGIDIPRSHRRVHNRAATVRESGTLHAVKSICTIFSVSTRTSGCHAPSTDRKHAGLRSCQACGRCQSAGNALVRS